MPMRALQIMNYHCKSQAALDRIIKKAVHNLSILKKLLINFVPTLTLLKSENFNLQYSWFLRIYLLVVVTKTGILKCFKQLFSTSNSGKYFCFAIKI